MAGALDPIDFALIQRKKQPVNGDALVMRATSSAQDIASMLIVADLGGAGFRFTKTTAKTTAKTV
ncbi:hypothetical protein [Chelativorans sp. J32]|uniref:hypothetical protein n=1 Tax=Chelativorans sp. J32 TaxID=935840 RepID=UPI0012EB8329|nr:hypothetical protein [Chelativorans sp. J32]